MSCPHTSTHKGKRVFIRLKDGESIVGKFLGKKARYILLEGMKIPIAVIKSFSINKNK